MYKRNIRTKKNINYRNRSLNLKGGLSTVFHTNKRINKKPSASHYSWEARKNSQSIG